MRLAFLSKLRHSSVLYNGILTTALITIGKGIGFVIPIFVAWLFGVTAETDAFFFAYGVIFFLSNIFSMTGESVLVPFIAEIKTDHKKSGLFVGNILATSAVILLPVTVFALILLWFLLPIIADFAPQSNALIFKLLLEISPMVLLTFWASVFNGTLNAHGIYWLPAISSGLRGTIVILFAFLASRTAGIHSLTLGYLAAEVVRVILSGLWVYRKNLLQFHISFQFDAHVRKFFKTSFYYVIGSASIGFNPIIDRVFASYAGLGGVTLLEYSRNVFYAVIGVISSGFFTVILSDWSQRFYQGHPDQVRREVIDGVKIVSFVAVLATLALFPSSFLVINLIYGRNISAPSVESASHILRIFSLALLPVLLSSYFSQGHLVIKNTPVLMQTALITNVSSLLFNLILFPLMGLQGLALSVVLIYILATWWTWWRFAVAVKKAK